MSERAEPNENDLFTRLRGGAATAVVTDAQLSRHHDLSAGRTSFMSPNEGADESVFDDRAFAAALVARIAKEDLGSVRVSREREQDDRVTVIPEVVSGADASFLGQLSVGEAGEQNQEVERIDDVRTLLAVLRAGRLWQRRAAALRIARLLEADQDFTNDETRLVQSTLTSIRDVEIAFEVWAARAQSGGPRARQARQESERFERLVEQLEVDIEEFWAGQSSQEPIGRLAPDERAHLMVRLRDAPDIIANHIASVLDGSDGVSDRSNRLMLLSSVRYSGDMRLLPALCGLVDMRASEFTLEAARAMARIDDPRVLPILSAAYERSVIDSERAILAGTLGVLGDVRAADYVRGLLETDDERVLAAALEAMVYLAMPDDCELLMPFLDRNDPVIRGHVVRALGQSGSARALGSLLEVRRDPHTSAVWADAEEAEAVLVAQLELRGEELPDQKESVAIVSTTKSVLADRKRDPAFVRLRSWWDFLLGRVWLTIGGAKRALQRFERAAGRRPGWVAPLLATALLHARRPERTALALGAFRRALDADRQAVERNGLAMPTLARVFLRRAQEVERDGRHDIARGLIEELGALDLRRVPSELRFELGRRREQLRRRSTA